MWVASGVRFLIRSVRTLAFASQASYTPYLAIKYLAEDARAFLFLSIPLLALVCWRLLIWAAPMFDFFLPFETEVRYEVAPIETRACCFATVLNDIG